MAKYNHLFTRISAAESTPTLINFPITHFFYFKKLLLAFVIFFAASCSSKKDLIYPTSTTNIINEQQLVNRFLQVPADASVDVKKIIANITKTEKATPFLANYAAKFGMPV